MHGLARPQRRHGILARHGSLACGLLASALFTGGVRAQPTPPRVEIRETEIDLGQLTRVDEASARFAIRNVGQQALQILSADPSCGCTVVDFDESIAPGKQGYIEATLDLGTVRGALLSQIHVKTDDPARPEVTLTLRAEVIGSVLILPVDDVYMHNRVGRLPVARRLLRRTPDETRVLEIRDLEASADWLEVAVEEVEAPRPAGGGLPEALPGDWLLTVAVAGEPTYGRREENVRFTTGLAREPEVQLPVLLELLPPVNLSAERVVLSAAAPRKTIHLSVREGADPSQLRATAEPAGLKVELEPADGRFFKLHVAGSDGLEGKTAAVVFHLGLETLHLPVEWAAPAPSSR